MSLVAYESSSASNSESDDEFFKKTDTLDSASGRKCHNDGAHQKAHLPSASQLLAAPALGNLKKASEIFDNPLLAAERAKTELLERHVKMVGLQDKVNGKKVCWSNRRGRCKFGSSCKYAHVSDLIVDQRQPAPSGTNSEKMNEKPGEQERKVCWSHRQGRCKYGDNCKFSHDATVESSEGLPSPATSHTNASGSQATNPRKRSSATSDSKEIPRKIFQNDKQSR